MSRHYRFLSLMGIIVLLMLGTAAVAGAADDDGSSERTAQQAEEPAEGAGGEGQEGDDTAQQAEEPAEGAGGEGQEGDQDAGGEGQEGDQGNSAGKEASAEKSAESQDDGIEPWVWVVILVVAIGVVGLVFLVGRNSGRSEPKAAAAPAPTRSAAERQQILLSTLTAWTSAGWVIESQSNDTAILSKDGQRRQVTIDDYGRAYQYELPSGAPPPGGPGAQPPIPGGEPPTPGAQPPASGGEPPTPGAHPPSS